MSRVFQEDPCATVREGAAARYSWAILVAIARGRVGSRAPRRVRRQQDQDITSRLMPT